MMMAADAGGPHPGASSGPDGVVAGADRDGVCDIGDDFGVVASGLDYWVIADMRFVAWRSTVCQSVYHCISET